MPESFIPVWMSVGEAENFQRTLHELDGSEAGLPERELSLIEGALERERPRTYAEMEAEHQAVAHLREAQKLLTKTLTFGGRVCGGEGHPHDKKIRRFLDDLAAPAPSPQAEVQDCERPSDLNWHATSGAVFTNGELWELRAFALQAGADKISKGSFARHALDRLNFVLGCRDCTGKQPPAEPQGDVVETIACWLFEPIRESRKSWHMQGAKVRAHYREAARDLLAAITPLLALEVKERLEAIKKFAERRRDECNEGSRRWHHSRPLNRSHVAEARAFGTVANFITEELRDLTPAPSEPEEGK
jgi:hypothetical protein